ncbi:MAG: hypothetical protein IJ766_02240 [Clostridia bacterium]|nr:hypothetical protein [Clostridia bacterium]
MNDQIFILLYKIFEKYDSEIEQRFINYRNDLYSRMREFDEVDYLHMLEIVTQRKLVKQIRGEVLAIISQIEDTEKG